MPTEAPLPLKESWHRRLYLPAYTVAQAARYAGTHPQTVSYWHHKGGELGPALPGKEQGQLLSYMQLVEVAFVATFRRLHVPLQKLRRARAYLAQVFDFEYPFAQLRLKTDGYHILMNLQEVEPDSDLQRLIIADANGQMAWEGLIGERFNEFDYDQQGLAITWHPRGRQSLVVIDPRVSFGAPIVHGVPTWIIRGRRSAGERITEIADDFGLQESDVIQALEFEGLKEAA